MPWSEVSISVKREQAPRAEIPLDENNIETRLDPGLAFGSGILEITAALKGAERVVCVDSDPQALEATTDNAARNGVTDRIQCLAPEAYSENSADFILADILAGPLVELAPVLLGSVKPGGRCNFFCAA